MEIFKKYFKFPLRADSWGIYIQTDDYHNCGMFAFDVDKYEKEPSEIVKVINGEIPSNEVSFLKDKELVYEGTNSDSKIIDRLTGKTLIVIRGWGYLCSPSFCHLKPEEAAKVQDEFGEYIVSKLMENKKQ